jgi:predicted TIM-barrel enzyme
MKKALGDCPLAIASGITPENVADYLEVADCFLVATGINASWTELDPLLVRKLVQTVESEGNQSGLKEPQ